MKHKYLIIILSLVVIFSCRNSKKDLQDANISTVTFSTDFGHYIRFIESKQNDEYSANLFVYEVPDSLSKFYQWRDSLILSAVQGDQNSLKEVNEKNLGRLDIELNNFDLLKNIEFHTPLIYYESNEEKIIFKDSIGGILYLPTLGIEIKY